MDKSDQLKQIIELCDKFHVEFERALSKAPFHMNLLDLCGANENAHTKILLQILKYKDVNRNPFLDALLKIWLCNSSYDIPQINYDKLEIIFNHDFIDGFICDGHIAIIIENKIHYAVDQNKQIERYIKTVESRGFAFENIYVVYLTRNGNKEIGENSCPKTLRNKLGERFIKSNYQTDIIPWLENDVLPICKIKDDCLVAAIKQYIDHLKGLLMLRKENAMQTDLIKWLKKETGWEPSLDKYLALSSQLQNVDELRNAMDSILQEHCAVFENLTEKFWKKHFGDNFAMHGCVDAGWLWFGSKIWNNKPRFIHLEWKEISRDTLSSQANAEIHLHFENECKEIRKFLQSDKEFAQQLESAGMQVYPKGSPQAKKTIMFRKPFLIMTDEERELFLNEEFELVKPLLDYVYAKCESVYENS